MVFSNNLLSGVSGQGGGGVSGTLWAWGRNQYGQLGLGDTTSRSSPVQIGTDTDWARVAIGAQAYSGFAIKTDGTLYAWGQNSSGQLGLGDTTHRSSPVQVGSLEDWFSISLSSGCILSIKTDGTLWTWGNNSVGQMGVGDTTNTSSPVQVGSLTNWLHADFNETAYANGYPIMQTSVDQSNGVIKSDRTVWMWGRNNDGELGQGDTTNTSSPVQVGSDTDWYSLAAPSYRGGASLRTDGTAWSWGDNNSGQLGIGNTDDKSSPVQVGSLTDWQMSSGGGVFGCAVKTDGTLWAWGNNTFGALGVNNSTNYSSPVQVGSETHWQSVFGGNYGWGAVTQDGKLFQTGYNGHGQLGDGSTTNRSSPVQIGSETDWAQVVGHGHVHTLAIREE